MFTTIPSRMPRMPHLAIYHYTKQRPPVLYTEIKFTLYSLRSLRTIFSH